MIKVNTHHIGEYCAYGTVRTETDDDARIVIRFYDFKTKSPIRESAIFDFVDKHKIQWYLEDNMSAYYADKVIDKIYA